MPRPSAYVASPLGFTEAGRLYARDVLLPALRAVVEVVDPWTLVDPAELAAARDAGGDEEAARRIGAANAEAIRACDVLVAVLEGQEIDSGTAAELGYAAGRGIRCLGLRTDLRTAGEPGVPVNLQVDAFLRLSGGRLCASVDELVMTLKGEACGS